METPNYQNAQVADNASVKIMRNTKGYNWELRVIPNMSREQIDKLVEDAFYMNNQIFQRFGGSSE